MTSRAVVEVVADATKVADSIQRTLNKALANIDTSKAKTAIDKVGTAVKAALGDVTGQAAKAGGALGSEIDKGSGIARAALLGVARAISTAAATAATVGREIGARFVAAGEVAQRAMGALSRKANVEFAEIAARARETASVIAASVGGALATGLTTAGIAITAGLGAITGFGLKTAASLEQTRIAFRSLLGSVEQGDAVFANLQKFAAVTPFEFTDLTGIAQKFLAFSAGVGLARDQLEPFLTTVGNVISVTGGGAQALDSVARAFGHIASGGKVSLEDINMLSDALPGFSGVAAIAAAQGISTGEAMDAISSGSISAVEGTAALIAGMQEFPGAAGAMEKQAETLLGVFSTFKDVVGQALASSFEPVIPAIKESLGQITPILGEAAAQVAPALGSVLAAALPAIAGLVRGLVPILTPILNGLGVALTALGPAVEPLGAAIGGILAAVNPLLAPLVGVVVAVANGLTPSLVALTPVIVALAPPLTQILTLIAAGLGPAMTGLAAAIAAVAGPLASFVTWLDGASKPAELLRFVLVGIAAGLATYKAVLIATAVATKAFAATQTAIAAAQLIYSTVIDVVTGKTKLWAAAQALLDIALDANPIGIVVIAVAALVAAIIWIATKTTWFQATWEAVWGFLKMVGAWFAGPFAGFFVDAFNKVIHFGSAVGDAFSTAWHAVLDFFVGIGHWFAELPGKIGGFLASLPGRFVDGISAMFHAGLHAIGVGIGLILTGIITLPKLIMFALTELPGLLWSFFTGLFVKAGTIVLAGAMAVVNFVKTIPGLIVTGLSNLGTLIGNAFVSALVFARDLAVKGFNEIVDFVKSVPGLVLAGLAILGELIGNAFVGAITFARDAAVDGFNGIIDFVKSVPGRIADLAHLMVDAGLSLIRGLMSGLGEAGNFVGDLASKIVGGIKGFLNDVIRSINSGINDVDEALPGISLPRIPQLATGGLTTREGLANLHPRELVLPLESTRTSDLLSKAINEANIGLRSVGVAAGDSTPQFDVRVYIGDTELTDLVDVRISERNRSLKARVQARR